MECKDRAIRTKIKAPPFISLLGNFYENIFAYFPYIQNEVVILKNSYNSLIFRNLKGIIL